MMQPHIYINNLTFNLPTEHTLLNAVNVVFLQHKIGLIGKNGVGKSSLVKLIVGELTPTKGSIHIEGHINYVSQDPVFPSNTTLAKFLGCDAKLAALRRITQGSVDEEDFSILNEEWDIEERLQKILSTFELTHLPYDREIKCLSGGESTRLFLARAFLSEADFLLLDEPTNHLDGSARIQLCNAIETWKGGLIIISHDRTLLNQMEEIVEITSLGINNYGGNYEAYERQKALEKAAIEQQLNDAKKTFHKTKNSIQASYEKHEQKRAYGLKLKRSGSIDKMAAGSKRGQSERTQSKMLIKEERMLQQAKARLQSARDKVESCEEIHIDIPKTKVPTRKVILDIKDLSFAYDDTKAIIENFSLTLQGPARIVLAGDNGSGKTTLIKLILNELQPRSGKIHLGTERVKYLDQSASILSPHLSILENFLQLDPKANENDAYRYLAQFLFKNISALKLVKNLSGGEKIRALLACVLMSTTPPQLLILDEPTNHLDINSIKSIESALRNYQGAMIVISHDAAFLKNISIDQLITAPFINYS